MSKLITIDVNQKNNLELSPLLKGSDEYSWVEAEFKKTGLRNRIESIQLVKNKSLWEKYLYRRLITRNQGKYETFGYHGTRSNDPNLICSQGLKNECTGYRGLYFASQSITSHGYNHNNGICFQMFMCRLLVPVVNPLGGVYIIKNNDDHYPQYLISYKYN